MRYLQKILTYPFQKEFRLNFWILAFIFVTFAIYFCGMPRYLDDFWYDIYLKQWREGSHDMTLWQAVTQTWSDHLLSDNVRLANIAFVPFLLVPKWIGSTLAAGLLTAAFAWGCRIAGVNPMRSPLLGIALAFWTILMPWYDGMGVENFQFNYILSTFLAVTFLRLFFSSATVTSGWRYTFLCVSGCLIGMWHEGFTAPLLAMCGFLFICCKRYRTPRQTVLLIGLLLGMIWFIAWPTSWQRVTNVYGETEKFGSGRVLFILAQHLCFIVMCIVILFSALIRKYRCVLKNPMTLALLISVAASVGIHFLTTRTSRTGWWGEFCSVLVIISILHTLFHKFSCRYTLRGYLLTAPILLLMMLHQVCVDVWAVRIGNIFNDAIERHLKSEDNVVFASVYDEYHSPLICMYAPDFTTLLAPVNLIFVNQYYHSDDERSFIPVPRELQYVTTRSGEPLPGVNANSSLTVRKLGEYMFIPSEETEVFEMYTDIDYGYTIKRGVRTICYPFVSQADGHRYAFVYPWRQVVQMRLGSVKAISPTAD